MVRTLIGLLVVGLLAACDGEGIPADEGGAPLCAATPVATISDCTYTAPIPVGMLPQPVDFAALTLFSNSDPIPRDAWQPSNGGHTITLLRSVCDDGRPRLISAASNCSSGRVDCSTEYGCR